MKRCTPLSTSISANYDNAIVTTTEIVDLIARGVKVSEIFHYAGGPFNNAFENPRVGGRDPQGRSYFSFASFEDPDGNRWLLQEVTTRLPGREWEQKRARTMEVATLEELL